MKYLSLFSGIEAATVAWHPLGWEPVAFSQYDPEHRYKSGPDFASAVLAHHYPKVPNLGDMLKVDWASYEGKASICVGGPPCQAFSVAGLRNSLSDARGNLSLAYVRAIHAVRPRWCLTENVPGWLSTKDNAFGCFLAGLVGADAPLLPFDSSAGWPCAGVATGPLYGVAWRVLDAQYFGVPQRRRRVFVVGHFGDWRPAAQVLFKPDGMPRNIKAGGEEGEGAAGGAEDRARVSHALGAHPSGHYDPSVETFAIQERAGAENPNSWPDGKGWQKEKAFTLEARQRAQGVVHSLRGEGFDASEDGTGRGTPIVIDRAAFNAGEGAQFSPQIGPSETAPTVQERGPSAVLPTAMRMREGKPGGGKGPLLSKDVSLSLATGNDQVLFAPDGKPQAFYAEQSRTDNLPKEDQAPPLKTSEKASVAIPIQDGRASRPNQNGTGAGDPGDPSFTLDSKGSQAVYDMRGNGDGEVCPTISKSSAGDRVADFAPMVFESRIARNGRGAPEPISPPLKAQSGETGKGDAAPLVFTQGNLERGAGPSPSSESCPTLKAQEGRGKSDQDPLVFTQNSRSEVRKVGGDGQIAGALAADHGAQQQNYIQNSMQVRRLTPRECERLQGFPDDYTLIPWRSARDEDQDYCETVNYLLESGFDVKSAMELADTPDGPRYKALGNSMCVDVMEWLGRRIQAVQDVLDAADKPKRKR